MKFVRRRSTLGEKCPCDIRGRYLSNPQTAINNRGGDTNAEFMTSAAVGKQRRMSKNQGGKT